MPGLSGEFYFASELPWFPGGFPSMLNFFFHYTLLALPIPSDWTANCTGSLSSWRQSATWVSTGQASWSDKTYSPHRELNWNSSTDYICSYIFTCTLLDDVCWMQQRSVAVRFFLCYLVTQGCAGKREYSDMNKNILDPSQQDKHVDPQGTSDIRPTLDETVCHVRANDPAHCRRPKAIRANSLHVTSVHLLWYWRPIGQSTWWMVWELEAVQISQTK